MKIIQSKQFTADKAWGALHITSMNGITSRLHWTDKAYHWHTNQGSEVFVVLDGLVDMYFGTCETGQKVRLAPGDIFYAEQGEAHKAVPIGEARILVVEQENSE